MQSKSYMADGQHQSENIPTGSLSGPSCYPQFLGPPSGHFSSQLQGPVFENYAAGRVRPYGHAQNVRQAGDYNSGFRCGPPQVEGPNNFHGANYFGHNSVNEYCQRNVNVPTSSEEYFTPQSNPSYTGPPPHQFLNQAPKEGSQPELMKEQKENGVDQWINEWMRTVEQQSKALKKQPRSTLNLRITDIQIKLLEYNEIIRELNFILMKLKAHDVPDDEWRSLQHQAESQKIELEELKTFFCSEESKERMRVLIAQRRSKRERVKRKKIELRKRYLRKKESWKEKEKKIDEWQKKIHERQTADLQDKKIKKDADMVLSEVRKKQGETQEIRDLLSNLCQLREVRMKKGEMHGYVTTEDNNKAFENMAGELKQLMSSQSELYNLEERTLRAMMEESSNILTENKHIFRKPAMNIGDCKKYLYTILFGQDIPEEKLNPHLRTFLAAEKSVEVLIKRRADWDQFITTAETSTDLSSSIPLGWVVPPSNVSPQWMKYKVNP